MFAVSGLSSRYGRIEVLHDVDLTVGPNEIVALVGANGAGKTTLLRVASGLHPIARGTVVFGGERIERAPCHRRVRLGLGHVPQGRHVFAPLEVIDNLRLGAWTRPGDASGDLDWIYGLFPILHQFRNRPAGSLSGGQQQMLAIGRALMARPKVLLLDEPSMGLAPLLVAQIFAILDRLRTEGLSILVVEQNVGAVLSIADRGYVIEAGRVTLEGRGSDLAVDPRVRAAYLGG